VRTWRILLAAAAFVAVGALGFVAWNVFGPGPTDFAGRDRVALSDYKLTDLTGVPASLIDRGRYLIRAADCEACHTAIGGQPFAGGRAFVLPFGTMYSTNITPDKDTGIGQYTDADFLAAVHRGVRRDGAPLYPAMPFPSYTYLTDADTLAIKAYLFSLEPINAPAIPNTFAFPFDQRWGMGIWAMMFNANRRFEPHANQSAEWNRGAYLVEALAHCGECHTPRNLFQVLDNRRKFAGAVTGGWRAFNITGDPTSGVGDWSEAALAHYLATGHAEGRGTAAGPMGEAATSALSISRAKTSPRWSHICAPFRRSEIRACPRPDRPTRSPRMPPERAAIRLASRSMRTPVQAAMAG
jgi:mono/diheme cytochrome c family protein